jgi:hypothetical protein
MTVALLVAGAALAAAPAAAQTPPGDSLSVTGETEAGGNPFSFTNIDIVASSGPSGEAAIGHAAFTVLPGPVEVGTRTGSNVTCLAVSGNRATLVFTSVGLGPPVVAHAVDNGPPGSGQDRFFAVPGDVAPGPDDCNADFSGFFPEFVTTGDVSIRDAPPGPATKDDCKKDGWRRFGFKNQGQCVSSIATGATKPPAGGSA